MMNYGSWTLGELVDAYARLNSVSICDGDAKKVIIEDEDNANQ